MLNKTIYEDGNGGQLEFANNDILTTDGLLILAYIAMFGGNREASTKPESDVIELNFDWWGNDKSNQSNTWINSETEKALIGATLNSQGLETIKQAIKSDVSFLEDFGELDIVVQIIGLNQLKITISLNQQDNLSLIWDSTRNEIIQNRWL